MPVKKKEPAVRASPHTAQNCNAFCCEKYLGIKKIVQFNNLAESIAEKKSGNDNFHSTET